MRRNWQPPDLVGGARFLAEERIEDEEPYEEENR